MAKHEIGPEGLGAAGAVTNVAANAADKAVNYGVTGGVLGAGAGIAATWKRALPEAAGNLAKSTSWLRTNMGSKILVTTGLAALGATLFGALGVVRGTAKGAKEVQEKNLAAQQQRAAAEQAFLTTNSQNVYQQGVQDGAQQVVAHIQEQAQAMQAAQAPQAPAGGFAAREQAPLASKAAAVEAAKAEQGPRGIV